MVNLCSLVLNNLYYFNIFFLINIDAAFHSNKSLETLHYAPGDEIILDESPVIDCKYCQVCLKYRSHCSISIVVHTPVIFRSCFFKFCIIKRLFKVRRVLPKGGV